MKNDKTEPNLLGRRRTLQLLGVGVASSALFGIAACKPSSSSSSGGTTTGAGAAGCFEMIDDKSKQLRRTLQYNDKAAVPEKHCSVCAQYIAAKYGDCGGCKVIPGPVQPAGGCLSFAPLGSTPPAASSG